MFDLRRPQDAYLFGLLQTDGTHSGSTDTKGRVSLELSIRDADILYALDRLLPCYSSVGTRRRKTNYSGDADSVTAILRFYDQGARRSLERLGLPAGPKAHTAVPPSEDLARSDYLRGLVDGDGSVGFTKRGYPYVSFVTASESLARYYEGALRDITGAVRRSNRNSRDGVFNIMVTNTPAFTMAGHLYYDSALALARKAEAARQIQEWVAPSRRYDVARRAWTPDEDAVVLNHSNREAAYRLGRTVQSVNLRRWRLTSAA